LADGPKALHGDEHIVSVICEKEDLERYRMILQVDQEKAGLPTAAVYDLREYSVAGEYYHLRLDQVCALCSPGCMALRKKVLIEFRAGVNPCDPNNALGD
jgi:hypothetical protein